MAVPVDRVQVLMNESPGLGGTQDSEGFPTVVNPNKDAPEGQGFFFQPPAPSTAKDNTVYVTRDASDNMLFKDGVVPGEITLNELITEDEHKVLRQLIHFIEDGPTESAYREITGTLFPSAIIWWESSSKLKKIVERLLTWTGIDLTTDQWKMYDTDGSSVLATVTDTVSYSGVFETSRTRVKS